MSDHLSFIRLARRVVERGFTAWLMDLRGHGRSSRGLASPTLEMLTDDLGRVLGEIGQPAFVIGQGFGGYLALAHALREPEMVHGLCLCSVDPAPAGPMEVQAMTQAMRAVRGLSLRAGALMMRPLLTRLETPRRDPLQHALRERGAMTQSASALDELVKVSVRRPDLRPRLPELTLPTLVLWGELDRLLPTGAGTGLMRGLSRTTGGAILGASRLVHIDRATPVTRAVCSWLEVHDPIRG